MKLPSTLLMLMAGSAVAAGSGSHGRTPQLPAQLPAELTTKTEEPKRPAPEPKPGDTKPGDPKPANPKPQPPIDRCPACGLG